jgi:hypothetical protein
MGCPTIIRNWKNINCGFVILGGGITTAINAFILIEAGQISGP